MLIIRDRRRAVHRLKSHLRVKASTLRVSIGEHRHCMITRHAPVLVTHVRPHRQSLVYALLIVSHHRLSHVGAPLREDHVHQRMLGSERVPYRKHRVVREPVSLMDIVVETTVFPIHIHVDRRIYHRVIERRVEHRQLVGRALSLDYVKAFVPVVGCLREDCVKILATRLRTQVFQSPFGAYARKPYLHLHLLRLRQVEIKICHDLAASHFREIMMLVKFSPSAVVKRLLLVDEAVIGDRLRKLYGEIRVVGACPSVGDSVARDQAVILHAHIRPERLSVIIVDTVIHVEHHMPRVGALGIRVAVCPRALRRGQFGAYAVVVKRHGVIPRPCHLSVMIEARPVSFRCVSRLTRHKHMLPRGRHDEHVAKITMSRAAQVRVAEPYNRRVAVLVACAVFIGARLVLSLDVVGHILRIGTQLDDTERRASTREGVPHPVRADYRIHIRRIVLRRRCPCAAAERHCCRHDRCVDLVD